MHIRIRAQFGQHTQRRFNMKSKSSRVRILWCALALLLVPVAILFARGSDETEPETVPVDSQEGPTDFDSLWRDPQTPESWFTGITTASELGITVFTQSPMLDARVANGELLPIRDRLPVDPPVVEPYSEVGTHGGTMITYGVDLARDFRNYTGRRGAGEGPVMAAADGTHYFPWFAEDVQFLEGDAVCQITFREGLRWSDGTPFIAGEEYEFWWNHSLDKTAFDPALFLTPTGDVVAIDDNTVQIHFLVPQPSYEYLLKGQFMPSSHQMPLAPMHVMRQYLPEFIGEAAARERAQEFGFNDITTFIAELAHQVYLQDPRFEMPTMQPYVGVSKTESEFVLERNPYYPFVDTEGNQYPYIDRMVVRFAAQRENVELAAMSGEADICNLAATAANIPTYIQNEDEGNYTTYIYLDGALSKPYYSFNMTPPEDAEEYADYYRNADFRRAVSVAINRDQINERFYFGRGIPMQATIAPMSDLFTPEYGDAYAQYDPDLAIATLDELGLVDRDGDGYRDFPDGSEFRLKLMYAAAPYLSDVGIHEYVVSNWADVGLQCDIDTISEGTFWQRSPALDWELKPHIVDGSMPWPLGLVRMAISPAVAPAIAPFGDWSTYFLTDGAEGSRPPADMYDEIEELHELGIAYFETLDEQYLVPLLESQAENIWVIGTVGFPPVPVLVNNRIRNVPQKSLWDEGLALDRVVYPMQWYINE